MRRTARMSAEFGHSQSGYWRIRGEQAEYDRKLYTGELLLPSLLQPPPRDEIVGISAKPVKGAMAYISGNGVTIGGNLCTRVGIATKDAGTQESKDGPSTNCTRVG